MGFTKEIRWWAQQEQSILSWVRNPFAEAAWAQLLKGIMGDSAPTDCGGNLREQIRVMLGGRTQRLFMRTGIADLALLHGMTLQREHLRSMRL